MKQLPLDSRSEKRDLVVSAVGTMLALVALAFLLAPHWSEVEQALAKVGWPTLIVLSLLMLPTLALRFGAFDVALRASGHRVPSSLTWPISAFTVLASTANIALAVITRVILFTRMVSPPRPTKAQLVLVDFSVMLIEGVLAVLLVVATGWSVGVPPWASVLLTVIVIGVVIVARRLVQTREERWPQLEGLRALSQSDHLVKALVLLSALFIFQIGRLWLCLHVVGLDAELFEAAVAFVAIGLLGALPIGPTSGPAALLVVFGSQGVAKAGAAGVVYLASSILGVIFVASLAAGWLAVQRRRSSKHIS